MKASTCQFSQCASQDYRHFSSTSTPREGLVQMLLEVLLQHFTISTRRRRRKRLPRAAGTAARLIGCPKLLLSLPTVNSFRSSIRSASAATGESTLRPPPQAGSERPHHLWLLCKGRSSDATKRWRLWWSNAKVGQNQANTLLESRSIGLLRVGYISTGITQTLSRFTR